jgi:hypothetical protein
VIWTRGCSALAWPGATVAAQLRGDRSEICIAAAAGLLLADEWDKERLAERVYWLLAATLVAASECFTACWHASSSACSLACGACLVTKGWNALPLIAVSEHHGDAGTYTEHCMLMP